MTTDPISPIDEKLTLTLPADLDQALDRAVQSGLVGTSREDALLNGFREWATTQGFVSSGQALLRPDELNAANDD